MTDPTSALFLLDITRRCHVAYDERGAIIKDDVVRNDGHVLKALRTQYSGKVRVERCESRNGLSQYWVSVIGHGVDEVNDFLKLQDGGSQKSGKGRPRKTGRDGWVLLRSSAFIAAFDRERLGGARYVDAIDRAIANVKCRYPDMKFSRREADRILREWRPEEQVTTMICESNDDNTITLGFGSKPTTPRIKSRRHPFNCRKKT